MPILRPWTRRLNRMPLERRLVGSHAVPLAIVGAALIVTVFSLVRMTVLSGQLDEGELAALAIEGELHRAAWGFDLALRNAPERCAAGHDVRTDLETAVRDVRGALERAPAANRELRDLTERYLALGTEVLAGDACTLARSRDVQARRTEIDSAITSAWVARLDHLHDAARIRDEEMRVLGTIGVWVGIVMAGLAVHAALLLSRRLAHDIAEPMDRLGSSARKLALGDFGERIDTEGPVEVAELAAELERMRARLAELDQLKQGFLASVSHELRTPLSKIREALGLLADGATGTLEERQQRVVAIARAACEREVRLVTTLLDLSRLRAGTPIHREPSTSIDEAIRTAVAEEQQDAVSRKVQVELSPIGEVPSLMLDPALVERAVANLVRNAVAVSPSGGVVRVERALVASALVSSGLGPVVAVRVHDEGPGVPAEIRDTIFRPFVTQSVTGSPKGVGIGLGLALAKEVAVAHGGDLVLEDREPRGTTFVLTFPVDADRAPRRTSAPPPPEDPAP